MTQSDSHCRQQNVVVVACHWSALEHSARCYGVGGLEMLGIRLGQVLEVRERPKVRLIFDRDYAVLGLQIMELDGWLACYFFDLR